MSTALITGGALRIGQRLALSLAGKGVNIALHYHNSYDVAMELQREIIKMNVKCSLFHADLADECSMLKLVPRVKKAFLDFDILINNASIFERAPILDTEPSLFEKHFAINLKAPFFLTKSFAEQCTQGNIINVLDSKITSAYSPYSAYNLSKKTLADFTKMSAVEFAPKIRINGIAPGLILAAEGREDEFIRMAKRVPLKNTGTPQLIADAVIYLINSEFTTGQIIYIDGGEHLGEPH